MNKKRTGKKLAGAFLMGLLVLSGGIAAMPFGDGLTSGSLKALQENSAQIVQTEKLILQPDLDYFGELNDLFAIDSSDDRIHEVYLQEALVEDDYEKWKEEFVKAGGCCESGFVSKEEFEALRAMKGEE